MDQARALRCTQSIHHLQRQGDHIRFGQRSVHGHALLQALPGDQFHRDEEAVESPAYRKDPHHVGMTHRRGQLRLALKLLFPLLVSRVFFAQHLDRNFPVESRIARHENHTHPSEGHPPHEAIRAHLGLYPDLITTTRAADPGVGTHLRHIHLALTIRACGQVRAHVEKR